MEMSKHDSVGFPDIFAEQKTSKNSQWKGTTMLLLSLNWQSNPGVVLSVLCFVLWQETINKERKGWCSRCSENFYACFWSWVSMLPLQTSLKTKQNSKVGQWALWYAWCCFLPCGCLSGWEPGLCLRVRAGPQPAEVPLCTASQWEPGERL